MNEKNSAPNSFRDRSDKVVWLDNLVRRKLRVSDPSDPEEIAGALGKYYVKEKEALDREAAGFAFLPMPVPTAMPVAAASSQAEVDQAVTDVERDLKTLKTNSLLKDIELELMGWEAAITAAVADGINAARQALDPRQRELAFANRRLLGDYARIARFVGALTPNMSIYFRRLAQSLDEVAAVLLVLMGESFANIGFAGGRFILQVAVADLQERRDAVIFSLRNLVGSTQESYGPEEWPRGLGAYSDLLQRLDESGHSDLKALLQENNVARLMDDLIHRASGHTAEGMRKLGATGQLALESLRRLVIFGTGMPGPASPPLAAFLKAVELFLDAFTHAASGYRLLFIARPPAVFYGLYGIGGQDEATRLLLELVLKRGRLAEMLDCYLGCICPPERVQCQILLDKVLYDLDRAIDFYARGTDPDGKGEPEHRAAAYGLIIEAIIRFNSQVTNGEPWKCFPYPEYVPVEDDPKRYEVPSSSADPCDQPPREHALYCLLSDIKEELCHESFLYKTYWQACPKPKAFSACCSDGWRKFAKCLEVAPYPPPYPTDFQAVLDVREEIRHELCLQLNAEDQWEQLLLTMAPSCIRFNGELIPTRDIIRQAICILDGVDYNLWDGRAAKCPEPETPIPATRDESLENIVKALTKGKPPICEPSPGAGPPTSQESGASPSESED